MPTSFTIFEILIIICVSQGLLTGGLLLASKDNQQSKKILGITVLFFCIANCRALLHSSGLYHHLLFRFFPVGMELFLPPLVYLYILSLTSKDFSFKKKHFYYFIPGLLYACYDISLYLISLTYDTMAGKDGLAEQMYFDPLNIFEDYLIVVLTLIFITLGYKKVTAYLSWLKQFKDYQRLPIYGWLKNMFFWSCIVGGVLTVNQLLDSLSLMMEQPKYRWRFFNLTLAFATYYIGFMGYKNDSLKVHVSRKNLSSLAKKLSNEQITALEAKLLQMLDKEAVYLDGSLTLKQLAGNLEVTSENLSLVVNQKFGMGFRDLINQYRVNRVKQLLRGNAQSELSILDIALDSGFNSQASFYRAFKKVEGVSPKEYMAQNQ